MKNFVYRPEESKKVLKDSNPLNGPNEHEGLPKNPKDVVNLAKVKKEASQPNRSAYNCSLCKGEGLVESKLCDMCHGTGKV